MIKRGSLVLASLGVVLCFTLAQRAAAERPERVERPERPILVQPAEVEAQADLRYPGDCDSKKLRKAAEKGRCRVETGGEHFRVFKGSTLITTIPHTVKENGTCRAIIKAINDNC